MADGMTGRSLGATLMSAASTIAIFSVANWDASHLVGVGARILDHTFAAFAFPLKALSKSLVRALAVRTMEKSLDRLRNRQGGDYLNHESVAIVTGCPIFIRTPAAAARVGYGFWSAELDEVQKLCPLELGPRQGSALPAPEAATEFDYLKLQWYDEMASDLLEDCFGLGFFDLWTPFQYQRFTEEMRARLALLALRLVPEDDKLRFLRSRNRFQSVVSALQASGYVLGVVERLWQHLAISPTEAIVCFFSLLVALQLLVEVYANGSFQRPLLLHLTSLQFASLRDVLSATSTPSPSSPSTSPSTSTFPGPHDALAIPTASCTSPHDALAISAPSTTSPPSSPPHDALACISAPSISLKDVMATTDFESAARWELRFFCSASFLFLIPSVCYYFHFQHVSLPSSLALFLFSLAPSVVAIMGMIYDLSDKFNEDSSIFHKLRTLSFIIQYLMYAGSFILAVVSTVIAWPLFRKPTHTWYAWILPHVSD